MNPFFKREIIVGLTSGVCLMDLDYQIVTIHLQEGKTISTILLNKVNGIVPQTQ